MITAKNYASQAVQYLKKKKEKDGFVTEFLGAAQEIIDSIENSVHFAVEDGGIVFDRMMENTDLDLPLRLPFERITIEYAETVNGGLLGKMILVAEENEQGIKLSYVLYDIKSKQWLPGIGSLIISPVDPAAPLVRCDHPSNWPFVFPYETVAETFFRSTPNGLTIWIMQWKHETRVFLEFLAVLSCKNVTVQTIQAADKKVNNRRLQMKKAPFFETKILVVNSDKPKTTREVGNKEPQYHVRQHLRRGHIRRHPTAGRIWINQCVVGRIENGFIDKQYHINH